MGVGMPQEIMLREFGEHVRAAFGEMAYHVGSSLRQKDGWRDVDVRVMLPDEDYAAQGYGDPEHPQDSRKWVAVTLAWSAFGRAITGLPIDFQVQQRTYANGPAFSARTIDGVRDKPRSALFAIYTLVHSSDESPVAGRVTDAGDQATHPAPQSTETASRSHSDAPGAPQEPETPRSWTKPCGCWQRVLADGSVDQLWCSEHSAQPASPVEPEPWNPDLTTAPRDRRIKLQLPPYVTGHLNTVVSVEPIAWAPYEGETT